MIIKINKQSHLTLKVAPLDSQLTFIDESTGINSYIAKYAKLFISQNNMNYKLCNLSTRIVGTATLIKVHFPHFMYRDENANTYTQTVCECLFTPKFIINMANINIEVQYLYYITTV